MLCVYIDIPILYWGSWTYFYSSTNYMWAWFIVGGGGEVGVVALSSLVTADSIILHGHATFFSSTVMQHSSPPRSCNILLLHGHTKFFSSTVMQHSSPPRSCNILLLHSLATFFSSTVMQLAMKAIYKRCF